MMITTEDKCHVDSHTFREEKVPMVGEKKERLELISLAGTLGVDSYGSR